MTGGVFLSEIPFDATEGMLRLFYTSILLVIIIILSYLKKVGVGKEIIIASIRGFCQLMFLALIFAFIFDSPNWWLLIWALFAVMIVMAGWTSSKRVKEIPKAWNITTPSILSGAAIALIIMAFTGIMPMEPQFVIPLTGMAFGNAMNVCSLTLNRTVAEVKNNKHRIEAALALGATAKVAVEPYLRVSIKSALIPNIDSLKTLGIIFIPGAMTGLLMAGTEPLVAAEYQVVVYFMILSAGIVTSIIASYLSVKRIFTEAHQLVELL